MSFKIGDRVVVTDGFGTYHNEKGTVTGFKKNIFGKELIKVQLDCYSARPQGFYRSELRMDTIETKPAKKSSPKLSDKECENIHNEAHNAGMEAANKCTPTPMVVEQHSNPLDDNSPVIKQWHVASGVCGFAWVNIKPGNSRFAKFLVKNDLGRKDSYYGGVTYWVSLFNQSMELKEAYAAAYMKVLHKYNIKAYFHSRMD